MNWQQVLLYGGPLDGSTNFQVPVEEDGTLPLTCTFPAPVPPVVEFFSEMLGEDVEIELEDPPEPLLYYRGQWPTKEDHRLVPYIYEPIIDNKRKCRA